MIEASTLANIVSSMSYLAKSPGRHALSWATFRLYTVFVLVVTLIISLLEFTPDLQAWLFQILGNLVITLCITFAMLGLTRLWQGRSPFDSRWSASGFTLICALSGVVGGLVSWGINSVLFGFHLTSPGYFLVILAILANVFGWSIFGYQHILERLHQTAEALAEKEVNEQRLQRLRARAELEALQARVNPHFLFNTLNSIASLIPTDPQRAEHMVQRLSSLLRRTFGASGTEAIEIGEELEIVEAYLAIEKIRLGDRLQFEISCDPELSHFRLPPLLLQPLVENSVKHGIAPVREGGRIEVSCRRMNGRNRIVIRDTGVGFDRLEIHEGFGLSGVRERLDLSYGESHSFRVESARGVTITIDLPAQESPSGSENGEGGGPGVSV